MAKPRKDLEYFYNGKKIKLAYENIWYEQGESETGIVFTNKKLESGSRILQTRNSRVEFQLTVLDQFNETTIIRRKAV